MCGIAGAVGRLDARVLAGMQRASLALSHRGPDGHGEWRTSVRPDGTGVLLLHRRLAIIDPEPRSAQPMLDRQSGAALCYNGELYNFIELREGLERGGASFETRSDTEVLLAVWQREGQRCLEHLRGMFAFAIWDPRQGEVVLARDRLGQKPLYWCTVRDGEGRATVLFASELRALLESGLIPRKLSRAGLRSYLWNGFVQGPDTIVEGISLLPAGSVARLGLDDPRVEPRRFWTLPRRVERKATAEELEHCLQDTVRRHLISDVPVGVFLSGGIDSSAVACLAMLDRVEPVRTFTVTFEEPGYDEAQYARSVAQALGTQHTEVPLSREVFRRDLDEALGSLDQPTFDGINNFFVSRAVRQQGIKVALAGTGGDELFGGYKSFVDLPRLHRFGAPLRILPRAVRRGLGRLAGRARRGNAAFPPQTRWGKIGDILSSDLDWVDLYQINYGLYTEEAYGRLLGGTFERGPGERQGLGAARRSQLADLCAGLPAAHAVSLLELSSFIENRLLRDTDSTSMAVSLEVRVPLLDHVLIETVAALPDRQRFLPARQKRALRKAALGRLDPGLFDRPKSGFVLPIDTWCRDSLKQRMGETLGDEQACRAVGLESRALLDMWSAYQAGAPGLYWSRVWSPFALLAWCQRWGVEL